MMPASRLLVCGALFLSLFPSLFSEEMGDDFPVNRAPGPFEPTTNYESRVIAGWPIRLNRRLVARSNLCERVLKELDRQLEETSRRLPPVAVGRLRQVTIWFDLSNTFTPGGVYHPSAVWLSNHGYNPDMARCVAFGVARNFIEWPRWQPYMVMHELAHAWHHQVLGYDYGPLQDAYRRAMESKTYEQVLHIQGQTKRHYGLQNAREYFAETTEAFFGVNDFYPFVRPELIRLDPTGARAVEEAWGVVPK